MSRNSDAPPGIEARLSTICLALPDAYEEPAWVGTRWRVRHRTFAHVLTVDPEHPAAYATASGVREPTCVMTFRSPPGEMAALVGAGLPYFRAGWGRDVMGMVLDGDPDWDEVAELVTESYRVLAPAKLVRLLPDRNP